MQEEVNEMVSRKTTKELLGESLHELSENKPIDKITVKEIVENCGMSSATFYRHFHDKYELIAWIYNYQMEDIFLNFCRGTKTWRQAILDMVTILDNDRDFYINALKNTEGHNSISYLTHAKCLELLMGYIREKGCDLTDDEILFNVKFYLCGSSYSIADWCVNSLPWSTREITDYLYNAMPEKLKTLLI